MRGITVLSYDVSSREIREQNRLSSCRKAPFCFPGSGRRRVLAEQRMLPLKKMGPSITAWTWS